jgi:hypothetical protein
MSRSFLRSLEQGLHVSSITIEYGSAWYCDEPGREQRRVSHEKDSDARGKGPKASAESGAAIEGGSKSEVTSLTPNFRHMRKDSKSDLTPMLLENYGSVSSVVSRMEKTLMHDGRLRKRVQRLERQLRETQNPS